MKTILNSKTHEYVKERKEFKNGTGSLRGLRTGGLGARSYGHLPPEARRPSLDKAEYVVYSYWTPIAWCYRGRWYYPNVSYSPTTTQHQGWVKMGMAGSPVYITVDKRKGSSAKRVDASTGRLDNADRRW